MTNNAEIQIDDESLRSATDGMESEMEEFHYEDDSSDWDGHFVVDDNDPAAVNHRNYTTSTRAHCERHGRQGKILCSTAVGLTENRKEEPYKIIPDKRKHDLFRPRKTHLIGEIHRRARQVFLLPPHRCFLSVASANREGLVTWLVDNSIEDKEDLRYILEEMKQCCNGTHRGVDPMLTTSMQFFQRKNYNEKVLMCISLGLDGCDFCYDATFSSFDPIVQKKLFRPTPRQLKEEVTRRYYALRYHEEHIQMDPPSPSGWERDKVLEWLRLNPLQDLADVEFFQAFVRRYKDHLNSLPQLLADLLTSQNIHEGLLERARQQLRQSEQFVRVQQTEKAKTALLRSEQDVDYLDKCISDIRQHISYLRWAIRNHQMDA